MKADKGHPEALYRTAFLYEHGLGVKKDMRKALEYYKKAANKGDKLAIERLKEI